MKKNYLLTLVLMGSVLLLSGCPKRVPVGELAISRLEAERSIALAQSEIDEAREVGADVLEPETILTTARDMLERENFADAKDEADRAGKMAKRLKDEILATIRIKEDASAAIERARGFIDEARYLGGNVIESEELLSLAVTEFDNENYPLAIELADNAASHARKIIATLEVITFTVGTWEHDRDALWNIAARPYIFNDPWKWKKIFKANRHQIEDPNLIFPNQVLIIPKD